MSLPVCKFYSHNKKCKFEEHCKFSHSVNDKPPPSRIDKGSHGKPTIRSEHPASALSKSGPSSHFESQNHDNLVDNLSAFSLDPSATAFKPSQENGEQKYVALKDKEVNRPTGHQKKVCQYFAQHGTCAFGRSCRFSHTINHDSPRSYQSSNSNQVQRSSIRSRDHVPPRFQRQKTDTELPQKSVAATPGNVKEEFTEKEVCQPRDISPLKLDIKNGPRLCYLYKSGRCRWGSKCKFSHNLDRKESDLQPSKDKKGNLSVQSAEHVNERKSATKSMAFKQVLMLEELEEEGNVHYRQLDINYLERRFPKSCSHVVDNGDNFILQAKFSPSDPDWSFDVTIFNLEFTLPKLYPKEAMSVKVLGDDGFPETARRCMELDISDWLAERNDAYAEKGQAELVARSFLRWLDRNIEDIITEALKQLKRELTAKAAGLEFISAEKLQERYRKISENAKIQDEEDSNEESEADESDDSANSDEDDSEDDSYCTDESEEDERGPSLRLDPEMRGTEIALRNLQLKEKATALMFERLKLILQCSRCKTHEDITVMPGKVMCVTCAKCSHQMLATYRPSLAHQFSSVIGYLDLDNCTAFDLIFQDCKASVSCLNCSKQSRIDGLVSGQLIDGWCQACNARFKIATDAVKFSRLAPSGVDMENSKVEVVRTKSKKVPKDPQMKEGSPLPDFGTCKHYKHSYRWLRFPCCGKAYPCDVCHDRKEDHDMVFANRMICGHCCKEQAFAATRPCTGCGAALTKLHTAHWEGGSGCRDKITMSRSDIQKYKNMNKTVSNHKKKVQSAGSKKKTTKLRHH